MSFNVSFYISLGMQYNIICMRTDEELLPVASELALVNWFGYTWDMQSYFSKNNQQSSCKCIESIPVTNLPVILLIRTYNHTKQLICWI